MVLLSLSLGVAIFVSSFESVMAAQTAIAASANAMSSKAEWEVSRGRYLGVEDSLVERIRSEKGALAAPVIESTVTTTGPSSGNFLVVGVDLDSDQTSKLFGRTLDSDLMAFVKLRLVGSGIVVPKTFATKHSLKEGDSFRVLSAKGPASLSVVGILESKILDAESGGSLGFMDIHQAQREFGKVGYVDKIEVAGVAKARLASLCPSCQIERPGNLGSAAEDALGRIKSLLGVSMIALLVGILLIYNTVQVSVLERLQDIAILRAIGATRIQIFVLLLAEWFAIGLLGSIAGIAIGSGLAFVLVEYTKRTVNTMVPLVADAHIDVSPVLIVAALVIGVGTALAAAFFPVLAAANVRPLEILRPYSYRRSHRYLVAALIGVALFIASNVAVATQSVSFAIGISVTGLEFFGVALMFPQVVLVLGRMIRTFLSKLRNPGPFLAIDGMMKSPHRTAFTIMTFGCALMMTVATKTLVAGFVASTGTWMNSAFPFDISVIGNDLASSVYGSQVLPTSMTDKLRSVPGVRSAYSVRKLFTPYRSHDVMAIGIETDRYLSARREKAMPMWPPQLSNPADLAAFRAGKGTFLSSNFAQLYGVHAGQSLQVDTPTGTVALKVLGEVDDYSWQHGAFILDMNALESLWKDDAVSYIDVSLANGYSLKEVKDRVQAVATADRKAFAFDKQQIKEVTDSVLEQAVAMANLQAAIAIFIGVLGIVNAVWIGVINRKREIALWRAIGVTRRQIGWIILYEGLFVSIVSAIVGVVGGLYGGWVPLRSFSFDVTGYLYPMVVPWPNVLFTIVLALTLGLLAGILPARRAAQLPILDSIGYE